MKVVAGDWKGRARLGRMSILMPSGAFATERLGADAIASCVAKSRKETGALIELKAVDGRIAIIECEPGEDIDRLLAMGKKPEVKKPGAKGAKTSSAAPAQFASACLLLLTIALLAFSNEKTLSWLRSLARPERAAALATEAIETGSTPRPMIARSGGGVEALVAGSPNFHRHRILFIRAAESLIASGRCAASDFATQNGWRAAPGGSSLYTVDCGWSLNPTRVTLNARTGEIR